MFLEGRRLLEFLRQWHRHSQGLRNRPLDLILNQLFRDSHVLRRRGYGLERA